MDCPLGFEHISPRVADVRTYYHMWSAHANNTPGNAELRGGGDDRSQGSPATASGR